MQDQSKNLPGFFQFKGTTVAEALLDFEELGGELEDDGTELEIVNQEENQVDLDLIPEDIDIDEIVAQVKKQISITDDNIVPQHNHNRISHELAQPIVNKTEKPKPIAMKSYAQAIKSQDLNPINDSTFSNDKNNNNTAASKSNSSNMLLNMLKGPSINNSQNANTFDNLPQQIQQHPPINHQYNLNPSNDNHYLNVFPPSSSHPNRTIPLPQALSHPPQQLYWNPPNTQLRSSSMMKSNEITYVVRRVLDPMQSADPFSDDYYCIQFNIKKNKEVLDEAIANNSPHYPPLLFIPLPTWKDSKERIRKQIESTKQLYEERSRKWEEKEKVLGHVVKSDISRPKEMLNVPSINDIYNNQFLDSLNDNDNMDSSIKQPYSSRLWNMRLAVQKGYEALYTVQELQYLLHTPVHANNIINKDEVLTDIQRALVVLAQSLGIKNPSLTDSSNITLEGGLVAAILQTSKGKRLLSRSIQLLPPNHRWALLPAILSRVLQVNPINLPDEDKLVEEKLLKTLTDFIRYAHNYQQELKQTSPNDYIEFSLNILSYLRQCLKSVMVTFLDKNELRQALLSSRYRAEIMHIITQIGDKISDDVYVTIRNDWISIRETFMSMLDN
eukprot:gene17710-23302_t